MGDNDRIKEVLLHSVISKKLRGRIKKKVKALIINHYHAYFTTMCVVSHFQLMAIRFSHVSIDFNIFLNFRIYFSCFPLVS